MEQERHLVDFTYRYGRRDMGSFFYVMAIMGCTDGSAQCAEARVEQVQYASYQQCQAAMPAALMRNSDVDYPVVSATCRANGRSLAQGDRDKKQG
jgi:hypothetical protein